MTPAGASAERIAAAELADRLDELEPIGVGERGVDRLAWTAEDAALGAWFAEQAAAAGLRVERDPAGNRWAVPDAPAPWWAVGSHLDSVRDGGRFDGPLGVAAAFAIAARSERPLAVLCLADEEGARFNTPTFGSRALAGRLDVDDALARIDDDGTALGDALRDAGVDPAGLTDAPAWLERLAGFLELHIDQSRDVARTGGPVGVVSALAARLRLQVELRGRADHAGTTPRGERADALLAAARLIVAADSLGATIDGLVCTATRILVEPNAPTAVAAFARLWLDARGPSPEAIDAFEAGVREHAARASALPPGCVTAPPPDRVTIDVARAARSEGVTFDARVRAALRDAAPAGAPELVCFAGHDAGVLGERVPAGMVLVRNPTGVSHAPAEDVALEDAAVGATVLLRALDGLA